MYISIILTLVFIVLFIGILVKYNPEIDVTRDGDVLLWYNTKKITYRNRAFIKLFNLR